MGFLLAEILILLALAALLGAALASWWIRRSYQDVTVEYSSLEEMRRQLEEQAAWRRGLEGKLGELAGARVDLGPVERQVQAVGAAVAAFKVPAPDLGPLQQRLTALEARIQPTDLRPVLERLAALERKDHPAVDLGPVLARLGSVEAGLAGWRPTDLTDVTARLARLEALLQRPAPAPAPAPAPRQPGANLLGSPIHGKPDDLKVIKGIAEKLERLLHRLGVYYFWQMAEWDRKDVAHVNGRLDAFKGRIDRDRWVAQARDLARLADSAKPPDAARSA